VGRAAFIEIDAPLGEQAPLPPEDAAPVVPAAPPLPNFLDNTAVKPLLVAPANSAVLRSGQFEFLVDYGENGPALVPNQASSFTVEIRNLADQEFMGQVTLSAPSGWQVAVPGAQGQRQHLAPGGMARYGFVVRVPDTVTLASKNTVTIVLTPEKGAPTTCDVNFLAGSCWWFVGPFANMNVDGYL
jgi:hypothetical protein